MKQVGRAALLPAALAALGPLTPGRTEPVESLAPHRPPRALPAEGVSPCSPALAHLE